MVFHFPSRSKLVPSMKLAIVGMFMALSFAHFDTIWSIYLYSYLQSEALVGIVASFFTLVSFVLFVATPTLVVRVSERKLYLFALGIVVVSFVFFSFIDQFWMVIIIGMLLCCGDVLRRQSFGILVRDSVSKKEINKAEGLQFTFRNIGWLLGPLLAGYAAAQFSISMVFLFAALFGVIALSYFFLTHIKERDRGHEHKHHLKESFKDFVLYFKDKRRIMAYCLKGGVYLYWGIVYVYIPLYIVKSGLSEFWVGFFLFSICIPLLLFEYRFGKLADKKGYHLFFVWGFFILGVCSFFAFLFSNVYVVMILFVLASFGAACLEGTTESFFFSVTNDEEEEKFYGPFFTSSAIFNLVGKIIASIGLLFFSFPIVFFLLAVEMVFFMVVGMFVHD